MPVLERRVCSVLFADLVGFTPLSEARDPEEVRELLSRYFDTARTVITRYGGVVEKFIGDAVMAVWGTPVASEGDAERAVRAGLDLVAAVAALGGEVGAEGLALRAGVVTGEVAATLNAVGEGMVAGDAVNTAARVQSAAAPGTVWVDTATQRLAGAAVGFTDAGEHLLKGKAEPQPLWRATRVHASVGGAQRVDGLEASMVGRDAEDRTLRELFHAAAERRTPRVVTVSGAAGSGKSRLGWEFEKYIDGLAIEVWWHRGRCLSYGEGIAYWALAEALRQRFDIAAEDPAGEAAAKFLAALQDWIPSQEERSFAGVRLGRLLGLPHPDDTGVALTRDELFAGWRLFLERMAVSSPVVVLIEDAHHADDALLDFCEHVVDWARQSPIYLVLLGRDELVARRPALVAGRNRTSLTLDPLDERAMQAMAEGLVPGMAADAVATIVGQAQGNPLFLVETVRSLIDRDAVVPVDGQYRLVGDVGTLTVPDTLHALLAARLDALDPGLRGLVADAAVLGTSFPADALAAITHISGADVVAGLSELVRRDVFEVSSDPLSPERGQYVFSQNMLRHVAYDTLSRRDRRARHVAVAEHLRRAFAGDGEQMMDVVAQHYLDALSSVSGEDDDELRDLARACLLRAAARSGRAGAHSRAATSYVRAAELVADDPGEQARLWERAQQAYGLSAEYESAVDAGSRARELYLAEGQERYAARVLAETSRVLSRARRSDEGMAACESALEVLRVDPDVDTVRAVSNLANMMAFRDDPRAHATADEALSLAQALDVGPEVMPLVLVQVGTVELLGQRVVHGNALLAAAARLAEQAGDRVTQAHALNNLATGLVLSDQQAAVDAAGTALQLCRQMGDRYLLDGAAGSFTEALLWLGRWDEVLVELEQITADLGPDHDSATVEVVVRTLRGGGPGDANALSTMRGSTESQDEIYVAWVDATLAFASGDARRVLDVVGGLFEHGRTLDLGSAAAIASWTLGVRSALALGDVDEGRRFIAHLDERPPGHVPLLLRANRSLARAGLAALDGEEAASLFTSAIAELRTAGSPYDLALGLLDQAEYLRGAGEDYAAARDEAARLNEPLRAVGITERVAALTADSAALTG